ncbi:glycosyltransferase [Nafulsella turpanensis]|uniref:glycosyltransferase n=1 Tax=Nafulsella turpanensis TaxID=1265690 RepID=UPI0003472640|nr:glycosyltransferase [Nafulsella turpanensis]
MIKKRDFIFVGLQDWDIEIGSNFKNLAYEISKENRVLYVNLPENTKTRMLNVFNGLKKKTAEKRPELCQVNENLFVYSPSVLNFSVNWLEKGTVYNKLNRKNAHALSTGILEMAEKLQFKNYFLLNDSLMFVGKYLKEMLEPELYLYYIRDYLVKQPYFNKHGSYLEPETIRSADFVIANSDYLANYARKFNPRSFMVGQGCEVESLISEGSKVEPAWSQKKGMPVVGYVGSLNANRLDIPLLEYITEKRPDWQFVLVGPEDERFQKSALHSRPNVAFTGLQPVADLASWIKSFDVCMNPQLVNENTIGNYPRKIDEYLALGKPVVATATLAMEYFKGYVYLSESKEDFISHIEIALAEDQEILQKSRIAYAKTHSWHNNVEAIYGLIHSHLTPVSS